MPIPYLSRLRLLLSGSPLLPNIDYIPKPAHVKDCPNCQFRQASWREGGFCYMFREEPVGNFCGQFMQLNGGRLERPKPSEG